ncbi:MAG TPA: caspase family protein, partial [Fibrobacteria bacterium]|nr:caspase family protein [Fibrobacteria bacterium]
MRSLIGLALALSCQTWASLDSGSAVSRRFLVAASANDGGPGKSRLRFAHQDADGMVNVMRSLGGVDPQDVLLVQEPDTARLLSALRDVSERMARERKDGSRMELVLYYSGHSDEAGLLLGGQTLPYLVLRRARESSGADVRLAVLDACASGAALRAKGGTRHQAFRIEGAEGLRGQAFLTSSRAEESSQESDRLKGSVFTRAFLTGLRGAADLDHDNKVTLQEAYRFAYEETLERTYSSGAGPQHPEFQLDLSGSGEVILTDLSRAQSQLELGPEISGRIVVTDSSGHAVADLTKKLGQNMSLGLPAGTYRIQTSDSTTRRVSRSTLAQGGRISLAPNPTDSVGPVPPRWADTVQAPMAPLVDVAFHLAIAPDWNDVKVPGQTTDGDTVPPNRSRYRLGIDLLEGEPAEVDGAHIALGISNVTRNVTGAQIAVGMARTGKRVRGAQIAVGYARIVDSLNGLQLGSLAVMDGSFHGLQVSPGLAIALQLAKEGFAVLLVAR